MKRVIIAILLAVIAIVILFTSWYNKNIEILQDTKKFNSEYENYLKDNITGVDITTIINKAIENNNINNIPKNKKGMYENDGNKSIEIMIKLTKDRKILSDGII